MNNKEFDTLVFIGRMQPFHNGHESVITTALEKANEVIVVLGSSFQPRSTKNPFTFEERKEMIRAVYPQETQNNDGPIKIVGVRDYPYDDNAWVSAVQSAVDKVKTGQKVGLVGHSKDNSSYYLKIFPKWSINTVEVSNVDGINATDIRNYMFENWHLEEVKHSMPEKVHECICDEFILPKPSIENDYCVHTRYAEWFEELSDEYKLIKEYKDKSRMRGFNFPSVFVTTDAVLAQSGHVLLIKRGGFPYKDCWALPGGYLDKGQFVVGNMIKELREETGVKVPDKVLKGSIKDVQIFDHPDRDPRGRTITHGFYIDLGYPAEKLPKVKGADDAKEARWFPLSEVTSEMMAFDHYAIISHFIRI